MYGEEQREKIGVIKDILKKRNILKANENKKAIDLGCGTGISSIWLKELGYEVYGFDISNKLIEIAKRDYQDINFIVFDADKLNKLKFRKNSYHLGVSLSAFQNFKQPKKVYKEFKKICKYFIITIPEKINKDSIDFLKDKKELEQFNCGKDIGFIYTP